MFLFQLTFAISCDCFSFNNTRIKIFTTGYTGTSNGQLTSGYVGKGIRKGYPDATKKSYLRNKTMRMRIVAQNTVSSRAKEKAREVPVYEASQTLCYYSNSIVATGFLVNS